MGFEISPKKCFCAKKIKKEIIKKLWGRGASASCQKKSQNSVSLNNDLLKILFGHQNDIAAMLESDKRQK